MTGQPDFATLRITYVPDVHLIELKSLKLYINAYRNVGIFHEFVTNKILERPGRRLPATAHGDRGRL